MCKMSNSSTKLLLAIVLMCGSLLLKPYECRPSSTEQDIDRDDYAPVRQQQRGLTQRDLINNGMNLEETQAIPVLIQVPDTQSIDESPAESRPHAHISKQPQQKHSVDLKTAASHHGHHGHGAKGWLDMGAWTAKKGAFGWHDKHPVGKGK